MDRKSARSKVRKGKEGKDTHSRFQCSDLGADHKAALGGWDATGPVHRKEMMIMMVTIIPASKPLQ